MLASDGKALSFKIDGGKLYIVVDSNIDGQPVVSVVVDLVEVPDEVVALIKGK